MQCFALHSHVTPGLISNTVPEIGFQTLIAVLEQDWHRGNLGPRLRQHAAVIEALIWAAALPIIAKRKQQPTTPTRQAWKEVSTHAQIYTDQERAL